MVPGCAQAYAGPSKNADFSAFSGRAKIGPGAPGTYIVVLVLRQGFFFRPLYSIADTADFIRNGQVSREKA